MECIAGPGIMRSPWSAAVHTCCVWASACPSSRVPRVRRTRPSSGRSGRPGRTYSGIGQCLAPASHSTCPANPYHMEIFDSGRTAGGCSRPHGRHTAGPPCCCNGSCGSPAQRVAPIGILAKIMEVPVAWNRRGYFRCRSDETWLIYK